MADGMGNAENVLQKCDEILNDMLDNMKFIGVEKDNITNDITMKDEQGKKVDANSEAGKLAEKQGAGVYTKDPITGKTFKLDGAAGTLRSGDLTARVQAAGAGATKIESTRRVVMAETKNAMGRV